MNVQFILDANRLLKQANKDSGELWFLFFSAVLLQIPSDFFCCRILYKQLI